VALIASLACVLFFAPAATAAPSIGVGEQSPEIFSDSRWQALASPNVRFIAGWDALHERRYRAEIDHYMALAQASGANVLLGFARSRTSKRYRFLPTPQRFRREFAAWRKRYPFINEFLIWNEANHCSQPTCRRPELVAKYYNAARRQCPTCTLVGASVLDSPNMVSWVKGFNKRASDRRFVWGLHNYVDANSFKTSGTRAFLRAAKGHQVWFTETGGLVWRKDSASRIPLPESVPHAAKATKWLFNRLVPLSSRIKRVYLYHWTPSRSRYTSWDSALIGPRGKARPAFDVVRRYVERHR
jgi:hypothetical protein